MKTSLIYIIVLMLIYSCSTSQVDKNKRDLDDKLMDEFSYLSNDDFIQPDMYSYSRKRDGYKSKNPSSNVLEKESLARIEFADLNEIEKETDKVSVLNSLCYKKEYDEAFKYADALFRKYNKHPGYWNAVGICYLQQNDKKKALVFFNKAREHDKKYAPALNNIGVIYMREKKDARAYKTFQEALKLSKYSVTPVFNMANMSLKYGLLDQARKLFLQLSSRSPNDVDVMNGLANVELFSGHVKQSISIFNKIPKKYLSRPDIAINYAFAVAQDGDRTHAHGIIQNVKINEFLGWKKYYDKVKRWMQN